MFMSGVMIFYSLYTADEQTDPTGPDSTSGGTGNRVIRSGGDFIS